MDARRVASILVPALAEGRDSLTELEGLALLEALGLETPARLFVRDSAEARALCATGAACASGPACPLPGDKVVVKVISPDILHKTEVGGVAIVANEGGAIAAAIQEMEGRLGAAAATGAESPMDSASAQAGLRQPRIDGFTINEFVDHEAALGHELIVGYRFARDFGPVVSFGPGGIFAEHLAASFREGVATAFFSPATADRALVARELSRNAIRALAAGGLRETRPATSDEAILDVVMAFLEAAPALAAAGVTEFEVNPFVIPSRPRNARAAGRAACRADRLVALDVLVKLGPVASGGLALIDGRIANADQALRPVDKIGKLLRPASAAVAGVSEKAMNNGRIILGNLLKDGFDPSRLYVVKPGCDEIDGCRCFPDFASLPEAVDLAVLAVPAEAAAGTIADIAESGRAESIIVTTGGLEEKSGTEAIVARMRDSLAASRLMSGRGPLVNGGNCLGVRSVPGRYNTLFVPEYKLPMPRGTVAPIAIVSQSGAFAVSRISKHPGINPKYLVTCGNQMDLTVGDYLEWLAEDPELEVFAAYVEGFKPLDGEKALRAARRIADSGKTLILYRAGRTAAGARASASHTASIAGDYAVTKALFLEAGAVVVESLEDFDDALTVFALLQGRKVTGNRLGAVSNAGFECVAMADNLGGFRLASLAPATVPRLEAVFRKARIDGIVDIHNPVDLTPAAPDEAYDESFRAVLDDPNVDLGLVGILPPTPSMNSLAAGPDSRGEDITREGSLACRYGRLIRETAKPWVASCDAGSLYDPLVRALEAQGVPVFRTSDRALRMLNLWARARLGT
jgi:acyl-CoA synthetase (NDP forming)